jgi:hypothetical protein
MTTPRIPRKKKKAIKKRVALFFVNDFYFKYYWNEVVDHYITQNNYVSTEIEWWEDALNKKAP